MRRLLPLTAVALVACATPGPPAGPGATSAGTTSSGATSALAPQVALPAPSHPLVAIRIAFRSGSVDDPPGKEGLTALTAALMAEGGTAELSASELVRALYPMAAELEAVPSKETTVFSARAPRSAVQRLLPIVEGVVLRPRFDPAEFDRLRRRSLDAIEKSLRTEDDEALAKEALDEVLHRGHAYAHPVLGTVQGLKSITLDDVKAQWGRVFVGARLTLGVAGGYPDELPRELAAALRALPQGEPRPPLPSQAAEAPRFTLVEKPSTPTAISMGFDWPLRRGHPDFPAMVVAVSALGEHRQGAAFRLFRELREERGLNYGDYAYPEHFEQAAGSALPAVNRPRSYQQFTVWIRPVEPQHRVFALRAALYELDRWVRQGLTQEELDRVKLFLAGYTLTFDQTDSRRLGYALDDRFYGLERPWLEQLRARLPSLTLAEVNGAIRKYVDPARLRIVVATHGAAELASELRSGARSPITYSVAKPSAVLEADAVIEQFPLGVSRASDVTVTKVEELFER